MSRQCGHNGARALHSDIGDVFPHQPRQSNKNFAGMPQADAARDDMTGICVFSRMFE
jgi:hypothetical protein